MCFFDQVMKSRGPWQPTCQPSDGNRPQHCGRMLSEQQGTEGPLCGGRGPRRHAPEARDVGVRAPRACERRSSPVRLVRPAPARPVQGHGVGPGRARSPHRSERPRDGCVWQPRRVVGPEGVAASQATRPRLGALVCEADPRHVAHRGCAGDGGAVWRCAAWRAVSTTTAASNLPPPLPRGPKRACRGARISNTAAASNLLSRGPKRACRGARVSTTTAASSLLPRGPKRACRGATIFSPASGQAAISSRLKGCLRRRPHVHGTAHCREVHQGACARASRLISNVAL